MRGESIVPIADANIETGLSEGQDDQNRREDDIHPPMPENEAEIDMTENEVEVQEISSGRRRKKPAWAKDYVFCFRSTMAKTKTTPRAKAPATQQSQRMAIPAPRTICPVCKEFVEGKTEDFEKHLIECYKERPQCGVCGQTFRLRSYLIKHERLVHNLNTGKPAESVASESSTSGKKQIKIKSVASGSSTSGKEERKTSDKVGSDSDWQDESDYSLGDGDTERKEEDKKADTDDESNIEGRVVRKSTTPAKPFCPKRKEIDEKPEPREDERKVKVMKVKEDAKGQADMKDIMVEGQADMKDIKVECMLVKKGASTETVTRVTENGEDIYEDKVTRKKKLGLVNVAIGDIIPEGSIHTNDIQLQITGEGSVELRLKYNPKSDD